MQFSFKRSTNNGLPNSTINPWFAQLEILILVPNTNFCKQICRFKKRIYFFHSYNCTCCRYFCPPLWTRLFVCLFVSRVRLWYACCLTNRIRNCSVPQVSRFGLKLVLPQNSYSASLWAEARGLGLLAGYSILHTILEPWLGDRS